MYSGSQVNEAEFKLRSSNSGDMNVTENAIISARVVVMASLDVDAICVRTDGKERQVGGVAG
jgi:hypothetical protein